MLRRSNRTPPKQRSEPNTHEASRYAADARRPKTRATMPRTSMAVETTRPCVPVMDALSNGPCQRILPASERTKLRGQPRDLVDINRPNHIDERVEVMTAKPSRILPELSPRSGIHVQTRRARAHPVSTPAENPGCHGEKRATSIAGRRNAPPARASVAAILRR